VLPEAESATDQLAAVYMSTYIRPPNFEVLSDLSGSIFQQVACFQVREIFRPQPHPDPIFTAQASATAPPSKRGGSFPPGWGSYPGNGRPEGRRNYWESVSGGTDCCRNIASLTMSAVSRTVRAHYRQPSKGSEGIRQLGMVGSQTKSLAPNVGA
jgi:hypothetical protein